MQVKRPSHTDGFSLVELSIVLVILGLLVGGILASRSLIHAGEVRKLGEDLHKYQTATFAFRDKYFAPPGDLSTASNFWSDATNGDSNGRIGWNLEGVNYWHHLQRSGLLEGSIAPITSAVSAIIPETHVPRCPLGDCGYSMVYFSAWTHQPQLVGKNNMAVGAPATGNYTAGSLMLPEDAWNLDKKYDDGAPDTARFIAYISCTSGTYPDRTYNLSGTSRCFVISSFF